MKAAKRARVFLERRAWVISALALALFYTHPAEAYFACFDLTISRAVFQDIALCVFGGMLLLQAVRPLRGDALFCASVNLLPVFILLTVYGSRLSLFSMASSLLLLALLLRDMRTAFACRSRRRRCALLRSAATTFCLYFMLTSLPGAFGYLVMDRQPSQGPLLLRTALPSAGEREGSPAYNDLACILSVRWEEMGMEARMATLGRVLDAEAAELGIRRPALKTARLSDDGHASNGQYVNWRNCIELDENGLMHREGRDTLTTLLHECRHAYQYSVVEMIDWGHEAVRTHAFFDEARAWREEFIGAATYNSEPEGVEEYYQEYYWTAIESDAREYAQARVRAFIDDMWAIGGGG